MNQSHFDLFDKVRRLGVVAGDGWGTSGSGAGFGRAGSFGVSCGFLAGLNQLFEASAAFVAEILVELGPVSALGGLSTFFPDLLVEFRSVSFLGGFAAPSSGLTDRDLSLCFFSFPSHTESSFSNPELLSYFN